MAFYLSQAITRALEDSNLPVVTEYSLFELARPILSDGHYKQTPITRPPVGWGQSALRAMIRNLTKRRVLAPDEDFKTGVWRVVQSLSAASAEQAICLVDPFAYISHLSAMQRYGLTDRAPEALHMTTPARALWTKLRDERSSGDGFAPFDRPPPLVRIGVHARVRRRPVIVHESRHPANPVPIADEISRIADIGRVFVDMLDQPPLCGGMQHVLDVFDRHADEWTGNIIAAVDVFESPIVKVRAGYILDEMLGITDPALSRWIGCAQRGGSRKLDPHAPYGSRFWEKWMIAVNV